MELMLKWILEVKLVIMLVVKYLKKNLYDKWLEIDLIRMCVVMLCL